MTLTYKPLIAGGDCMSPNNRADGSEDNLSKAERRRNRLVTMLSEDATRRASVAELSVLLGVSAATIRRDLAQLERDEIVARTYGGAALAPGRREMTMAQRQLSHVAEKRAIAATAVSLVHEGDVVILDAGSTCEQIATAIDNQLELTVVTNGVRCVNQLVWQDKVHVLVLGGRLRGINETICGGDAELALSRIYGALAFVGADAVDTRRGIASRTYEQCRLKSMMLRQASQVYVVADSSKLRDDTDLPYWAALPRQWGLITDSAAPPERLSALRERGASSILLAGGASPRTETGQKQEDSHEEGSTARATRHDH